MIEKSKRDEVFRKVRLRAVTLDLGYPSFVYDPVIPGHKLREVGTQPGESVLMALDNRRGSPVQLDVEEEPARGAFQYTCECQQPPIGHIRRQLVASTADAPDDGIVVREPRSDQPSFSDLGSGAPRISRNTIHEGGAHETDEVVRELASDDLAAQTVAIEALLARSVQGDGGEVTP